MQAVHFFNLGGFAGVPCASAAGVASLFDPATQAGARHLNGAGFNLVHLREETFIVNPITMSGPQTEIDHSARK